MVDEMTWLRLAIGLYLGATAIAVVRPRAGWLVPSVLLAALMAHGASILMRWTRLDHGPYVDMFEILSSNVWTLHATLLVVVLAFGWLRPILATALPLLQILTLWLLATAPEDSLAPVTYETPWLALHVWLGKAFLGLVVVACGVALAILLRSRYPARFRSLPSSAGLEETIYRLVLLAFVFESGMLIVGALWAQDAWGRYWAWDPLETWAFLTWLLVAAFLHMRLVVRPGPMISSWLVLGVFSVAFLTFFGVPFVSEAPHKGAI